MDEVAKYGYVPREVMLERSISFAIARYLIYGLDT